MFLDLPQWIPLSRPAIFVSQKKIMKKKNSKILKWIPSLIAAIIITMSACMKLASAPQLVEVFSGLGLLGYMKVLGVAEIIFAAMFLVKNTMRVGFLLLTAYHGGAIAVDLAHGNLVVFPAAILAVIWIAAFVRDTSIFKSLQTQNPASALSA